MNIKIYVTEKVKDKYQLAAIKEYDKRLSRYCKIKQIIIKESELDKIPSKSYKIILNNSWETLTSEDLANKLETLGLTGKSDIAIVLIDQLEADEYLSLSKMTMSTGMTLTVLYEQIYRAFRIMKNEPYHK